MTVLILLLQASMTGCNYEPVPEPAVEKSQVPKELHKLTVGFPKEVGPVQIKRARANYSIENRTCVPLDHTMALGGKRPHSVQQVTIDLLESADAEYSGYLYSDAFAPADYYGLGVCRWTLESVDVLFGLGHDTSLAVSGARVLAGEGTQELVCPRNGHPSRAIWGCLEPTAVSPGEESDYFTVTVRTSRE